MRAPHAQPRNLWRVFRRLPVAEQRLTLRAFVTLPAIGLGLRLFGFNRMLRLLAAWSASPPRAADDTDLVARAVDRAARRWPAEATCLTRSLLLWWFLRRRGQPAAVWVGVRHGPQALEAHAWVELAGRVLNDRPDVRERYAPFEQPLAATP